MAKLQNQFTINLDDDAAEALRNLARLTQRKPAELLRLLVNDPIYNELARITNLGGQFAPARFVPGVLPGDAWKN